MIQMMRYRKEFEQTYMDKVVQVAKPTMRCQIAQSIRKYFPKNFLDNAGDEEIFQKLILAEYKDLKRILRHIQNKTANAMRSECFTGNKNMTSLYKAYYKTYEKIRDVDICGKKMNVQIIHESGMHVCPYCNRDYINSRGTKRAGAQLDHFYPRSRYPFFALSLYNLIPSCAVCNNIKANRKRKLISPFDETLVLDKQLTFTYTIDGPEQYDTVKLKLKSSKEMKSNMDVFMLEDAYQIHDEDVRALLKKRDIYVQSQIEEIINTLKSNNVDTSVEEIRRMVFGEKIDPGQYGKTPLSKLKNDILKTFI